MMIAKNQSIPDNYKLDITYYKRARDAMFEAVLQLVEQGYKDIYIPGYIGWSPKEGSGIFDPLNSIPALQRHYYKMTRDLRIDSSDLIHKLKKSSILLLVNYFGFRDEKMDELIEIAHSRNCVVIEDNAHGFYTYFYKEKKNSDLTFFSLHKMFPFSEGGALIVENNVGVQPRKNIEEEVTFNPFGYDINAISRIRIENYKYLMRLIEGKEDYFTPLRSVNDVADNVPQTCPIVIRKGDRNKIYEIMNSRGYGVVSLYHTMIEELRTSEHEEACWLSARIMNLPVHQDCDIREYMSMIETLIEACSNS